MTVNTKTSVAVVTAVTVSKSGTSSTTTQPGTVYNQIYSVGDKVYYSYKGGVQLPCVVAQVIPSGSVLQDATFVSYEIQGDIRAGSNFPAGFPRGPFRNISATVLTDR
jgi:hypothetical protein